MYSCPWPYLLRGEPRHARQKLSAGLTHADHDAEIDAVIDSESTYPPSATLDAVHPQKTRPADGAGQPIENSASKVRERNPNYARSTAAYQKTSDDHRLI